MTDHVCPHPTCTKSVIPDKFFFSCAYHWFELPLPIRNEIWTTYRRAPGSPEHVEAMAKALAFWKAQLHWR